MSSSGIVFSIIAICAILGGLMMITLKKVMHMTVAMILTYFSIAALYVLLTAEFVAVAQVLVYSGGITILMVFGIMLTYHKAENRDEEKVSSFRKLITFLSVATLGIVSYFLVAPVDFVAEEIFVGDHTKAIGEILYTNYIIPFELVSILLLVALIGAVLLAKKDKEEANE
ncbi:MAG: NADH-ubiquinone oxidoreductase chain [Bacillales bacterium]|jgi:NADH-quinone oxidoreductase subunit J|nr:NADH-ubiquinone oxidoreductase chain [Bacillales bacterium]